MIKKLMRLIFTIGRIIIEGEVKKTIELNDNIIIDFDDKNKLIGVEILDASKLLNKKALAEAQII